MPKRIAAVALALAMLCTLSACVTLLVPGPSASLEPAAAQQLPSLAPGRRVRVTAPSAGMDGTVGTIRAVRGREIVLEPEWPRQAWSRSGLQPDSLGVAVPLDSVPTLEVSLGTHRHFWAGAGIGAMIGGLGLSVAGAASAASCHGWFCFDPVAVAGAGLVVGGVVGGLLGGIVGAAIVTDDWASVPLSGVRLGLVVTPGGRLGLGASLAF